MNAMTDLRLSKVSKTFGAFRAVNDLTLTVAGDEVLCLLGPSGCGKSTTLRMIAGLESVSDGSISIGGSDVTGLTAAQRNVAMAFQFYALYPSLTVAQNIAMPLDAEGLSTGEQALRVGQVMERLSITHVRDALPAALSEGDKQRVAVARCIVREARVFLFDEPMSRLDVGVRVAMRSQLKEILGALQRPTVIVTHDQEEAITMGDRIAVMRQGRLEQIGTPLEVFDRPANRFVAEFIGTPRINIIEGVVAPADGRLALVAGPAALPLDAPPPALRAGDRMAIGMRPRALSLCSPDAPGAITGTIHEAEPTGPETQFHIHSTFGDVRVMTAQHARTGDRVGILPDLAAAVFFDEAGLRMEGRA